jgi:hypothetical protein
MYPCASSGIDLRGTISDSASYKADQGLGSVWATAPGVRFNFFATGDANPTDDSSQDL